ncbi:MliC family protein [Jannaschia sp. W003]|uniref:MliC family protein n=1 Tax=Jannaschia sp. W003 TaxID=2867012 RepID=UPI0021A3D523|nr:MliC family protein [Jannaschia sp. W003]UWQ22356.1 MliC family protein [Jannaschia sp. W003]
MRPFLLAVLLLAACVQVPPARDLYACDGGLGVLVDRSPRGARLTLSTGEHRGVWRRPVDAGTRYVADGLIWYERGDEAMIQRKGTSAPCRLVNRNV